MRRALHAGWRWLAAPATLATTVSLSVVAGSPTGGLPAASMGWELLFHVERAAALLASMGTVLLIGARAAGGEFPTRLGQVEYTDAARAAVLMEGIAAQDQRIQAIEELVGLRGEG